MICLCNLYCKVYKSLRAPQYIPSLELVFPPDHYLRLVLCLGSLSPFRVFAVEPPRSSVCLPLVTPASLQASIVPSCVYSVVWLVADKTYLTTALTPLSVHLTELPAARRRSRRSRMWPDRRRLMRGAFGIGDGDRRVVSFGTVARGERVVRSGTGLCGVDVLV